MKKRKLSVKAAIRDWIFENSIRDKSFVVDRCRACMPAPNLAKLVEQYWGRVAGAAIASVRDKNLAREAFPVSTPEGVMITHVSTTDDIHALQVVEKRLVGNIEGNRCTLVKISRRKLVLEGQMELDFGATGK